MTADGTIEAGQNATPLAKRKSRSHGWNSSFLRRDEDQHVKGGLRPGIEP
jgi:hypothetical protein